MKRIKMVAIDLDDTLVKDDGTVSDYTVASLQALQSVGVEVVIATGRMFQTAKPVADRLALGNMPLILYSGGLVCGSDDGNVLWDMCVPVDRVTAVCRFAQERGWYIQYASEDKLYVPAIASETEGYMATTGAVALAVGEDFYSPKAPANKLLLIADASVMGERKAALEQAFPELHFVLSKPHYLEIIEPEVAKGRALKALCAKKGIGLDEVVAFGNAQNDISMFEVVGTAVVVANGHPLAKEAADFECLSNNDDGVAHWLGSEEAKAQGVPTFSVLGEV